MRTLLNWFHDRTLGRWTAEKIHSRAWSWLAWRMPKSLVYYCGIRMGAHATTGQYSDTIVPDLPMMEMIKRWPVKRP